MNQENKPIRVAQIMGDMSNGGVRSLVLNFYKHIDKTKFQFDFIVNENSRNIAEEEILAMGGRVYKIPTYKHFFSYKKALRRLFRENHYQIVHSRVNSLSVFPLQVAKQEKVPVRIADSLSSSNPSEVLRNTIKFGLKLFSKKYPTDLTSCSSEAAVWLFGKKAVKQQRVTVIPPAIETRRFAFSDSSRNEIRSSLGIPKDAWVVGNIGRLVKQKNQSYLIRAFAQILRERPNSYLLFVSKGPLEESLRSLSNKLGLGSHVIFTDTNTGTAPYYSAMDCFALPSLYEGFAIVLIEAQANGLPCIISEPVPKEADLTSLISRLPISNRDLLEWSSAMATPKPRLDSTEAIASLEQQGYDVSKEARALEKYYEDCLSKSAKH